MDLSVVIVVIGTCYNSIILHLIQRVLNKTKLLESLGSSTRAPPVTALRLSSWPSVVVVASSRKRVTAPSEHNGRYTTGALCLLTPSVGHPRMKVWSNPAGFQVLFWLEAPPQQLINYVCCVKSV
jgi:hypothetical protein